MTGRVVAFASVVFVLCLVAGTMHLLGGTDGKPLSPEAPKHEAVQARGSLQADREQFFLIVAERIAAEEAARQAEAARVEQKRRDAVRAAEDARKRRAAMERRTVTGTTQPHTAPSGDVWHSLAMCETGGKMNNPNTGNGYYGFFQFSAGTWASVGGPGLPHHHSYEVQRSYAQKLQARSGWAQWPRCSRKLGLR